LTLNVPSDFDAGIDSNTMRKNFLSHRAKHGRVRKTKDEHEKDSSKGQQDQKSDNDSLLEKNPLNTASETQVDNSKNAFADSLNSFADDGEVIHTNAASTASWRNLISSKNRNFDLKN